MNWISGPNHINSETQPARNPEPFLQAIELTDWRAGLIKRRGFYIRLGKHGIISCHINGYGHGSQIAARIGHGTGAKWYGYLPGKGWAVAPQQPLKLSVSLVVADPLRPPP